MAAENPNGANIEELTGKTEQFIEDNSRNLIIGIAAVAVIIVAVVGYGKFIVEPTEMAANGIRIKATKIIAFRPSATERADKNLIRMP